MKYFQFESMHAEKARKAWDRAQPDSRESFVRINNIKNGLDYINITWAKLPEIIKEEIKKYYKPLLY